MIRTTKVGRAARILAATAVIVGTTLLFTGVANATTGTLLSVGSPTGGAVASGHAVKAAVANGQNSPAGRTHQGGCNPHIKVAGFDVGVCIDDRATGTTAYPDIYVNTAGARANCGINISVWDDHNHRLSATEVGCATGHYPGNPVKPKTAAKVHTFARLDYTGQKAIVIGDSPPIQLSPDSNQNVFYDFDYILTVKRGSVGLAVKSTVSNVFKELHRCYNCSFPVPGAPAAYPSTGQAISLTANPSWIPWPDAANALYNLKGPILIYPRDNEGVIVVVATSGHSDGVGANVTFRWYTDSKGYMHMHVTGVSVHIGWNASLNWGAARLYWQGFADKLANNLVWHHEGTILGET